ncbi:MAG: hypothetical protein GY739_14450 [Mesoflavibacter sp.]|nr:hypothetical protein [Mesoflavibacter sp.]
MLCKRHNLTSKEALNSIDDILKQDLHTWIKVLQNQIKVMHIGTIGAKKYPLDLNEYNITKLDERNQQIINDFQPELLKALKTELKEEDVIKWVEDIITGITNK